GEHTIRLTGSEPIVIESLSLTAPVSPPTYEEYASKQPSVQAGEQEAILIEAEHMTTKNEVAIQMAIDKSALTTPEAGRQEVFNSVGGSRWQNGGQTIDWTFTVPADG